MKVLSLVIILLPCSHYFVNGGFFRCDSQVLDDVEKIQHIPCSIIQGRYDMVCPADTAWQLHKVVAIRNSVKQGKTIWDIVAI